MRLEVVTPKGPIVEADVDEVTAPGALGEFGVLPGHIPFLTGIKPGVLTYRHGAETRSLAVGAGFAEIAGDRMVVLADAAAMSGTSAVSAGSTVPAWGRLDAEEARRELAEVQRTLDATTEDEGLRAELEVRRQWAQARLDLANAADHGASARH